ncbi:MAG: protein SanA [Flavipsychrobacter sp.]|nr:protein SanA [Flavipsychrobacter sp.]
MFKRFLRYSLLFVLLLLVGLVVAINYMVKNSTAKQLYTDVNVIPKNKVGLLLGTAKFTDKARKLVNVYYQNRIDATVALYMAGKIDYVIVSGDKSPNYDEPAIMKADLVARGIPAGHIYMDNSGFRTLDSILRCRDIFGQDHVTIISQEFHNRRALYIANHKKVTAIAYNAKDGSSFADANIREVLARVRMGMDLVLNKQAKYYGERIDIP